MDRSFPSASAAPFWYSVPWERTVGHRIYVDEVSREIVCLTRARLQYRRGDDRVMIKRNCRYYRKHQCMPKRHGESQIRSPGKTTLI